MRRYGAITAALALFFSGAIATPAGASVHRTKRTRHATRRTRTVSFYATVLRANPKGLVVRNQAGRVFHFSVAQIARRRSPSNSAVRRRHRLRHHRLSQHNILAHIAVALPPVGPVAVNIIGLQPGVTVLITETVSPDGQVTVTITLPPTTGSGQRQASGVVTDVSDDAFELSVPGGDDLRLHMAADQLASLNLESCSTVTVTYHQDAGMLIADSVQVTGTSGTGDCASTYDAMGAITQASGQSVTIASNQGPMTFSVSDPDVTDCFKAGDVVDVTYTTRADGTLNATNVQFVEQDASGQVTAVSSNSLTITDGSTGQSDTFVADPSQGLQLNTDAFTGVRVGDHIHVTYHQSAAGNVADTVDDEPGDS